MDITIDQLWIMFGQLSAEKRLLEAQVKALTQQVNALQVKEKTDG